MAAVCFNLLLALKRVQKKEREREKKSLKESDKKMQSSNNKLLVPAEDAHT